MTGDRPIPYGRQTVDDDDVRAVVEVLKGDWLTQGPAVNRFESALAEYCGARYAVAVCNGTVALHLACLAAGIGSGDEGITSPISFLASANCLIYCGARPMFADIDKETWNIDAADIENRLGERTKVLIPVHFAGLPCDMPRIRNIAERNDLVVIEDACHALGAVCHGHRIGSCLHSEMTVFSFHPVKQITTGEGGAVLTNDDLLAKRLRRFRHHGIDREAPSIGPSQGPWYYEVREIGYNGRITDFQCALGMSQLAKLDRFVGRRRAIAARYRDALQNIPGLAFQVEPIGLENSYHLLVIHLDPALYDRAKVFDALLREGVAPQVHYIPLHTQPAIRQLLPSVPSLPVAERYYSGCLSLPMYPALTDEELEKVIAALQRICRDAGAGSG